MEFLVVVGELIRRVRAVGKKNHPLGRSQRSTPRPAPRGGVVVKAEGEVGPQLLVHLSRPGLDLGGAVKKELGIPTDQSVGGIRGKPAAFDVLQHVPDGLGIEIRRSQPGGGLETLVGPDDLGSGLPQTFLQQTAGFQIEFALHHRTIPSNPKGPLLHVRPVPADMTGIETDHLPQKGFLRQPGRNQDRLPLPAFSRGKPEVKKGLGPGGIPKKLHPLVREQDVLRQLTRRVVDPPPAILKLGAGDGSLMRLQKPPLRQLRDRRKKQRLLLLGPDPGGHHSKNHRADDFESPHRSKS